jgi:hypothetical protein
MKATFTFLFLLLFIGNQAISQTFGNEWINFSQKYLKLKISEEGLFKITYDDVVAKNLQIGTIDPHKFQIFNKGIQTPLLITGTNDGVFNQGDIIYFYGNKNDASLDKILYNNQNDLPNEEVSLFNDDNFYFLTYHPNQNGLRYTISNEPNSGLTSEPFIIAKERLNFANTYYNGEFILEGMSLSEYIEGEGYLGGAFGKGQSLSYNLNTSDFINTPTYQPKLSFYVAGRSNASSTNSTGQNHHLRLSLGSTTLFDSLFRGYKTVRKTLSIPVNSSTTNINIASVDDLGAVTDFQAPAYLEISFARNLNLFGKSKLGFSISQTKPKGLLTFSNSTITNPILIEKNGSQLIFPDNSTSNLQFILNDIQPTKNYYLGSLNDAKSLVLDDVVFKNINSSSSRSFLIISHASLSTGALAYQQYNQTIGKQTALVYTEDLYNEFYYGFHHPMALRNYCHYLIEKGNSKPEYLLLLGRGYELVKQNIIADLVPTFGFPASDNMITAGLNGSSLEPGLATGRIPARTSEEIDNYLNKLKVYNGLGNDIWRKKLVHVSGGRSLSENLSYANYQKNLFNTAKNEFFGASVVNIKKNVADPVTESLTERIVNETKNGTALISFLGHGSTVTTEVLLGNPLTLNNKEKPTFYLVNGCSTGNVFSNSKSLGEQFLLQKDFGAIGWIGTTSEGVASYLNNLSNNFYLNWFKNLYNQSITKGIQLGIKNYAQANDKLNLAHIRQYIYLGDPSLKFNSPTLADYAIDNSSVFTKNLVQNSNNQTLDLSVIAKNLGKAVLDSIGVIVERKLENNQVYPKFITKIKPIFNTDTINISLNNLGYQIEGENEIKITIDYESKIQELNELNNIATFKVFLAGNGLNSILPLNNSIIRPEEFKLQAQPDNLFTKNAEYIFEIDTVESFNSMFKKSSGVINAGLLPEWKPDVLLTNNKIYFWRAKLNLPDDRGGRWTPVNSFTIKDDAEDGFFASKNKQLKNTALVNIVDKNNNGEFQFVPDILSTYIQTRGDQASIEDERRFRYEGLGLGFNGSEFKGISIITYHSTFKGQRFSYPSPYNFINSSGLNTGYSGQYYWDTNNPVQADSLLRYLKQIPPDYYVIGYNGVNAAFNELSVDLKQELRNLGLSKFEVVNRGEPYMFWSKKGTLLGMFTKEFTANYTSSVPAIKQLIRGDVDLIYSFDVGSIKTDKIGPANEWSNAIIEYDLKQGDIVNYNIIGIDTLGNEIELLSSSNLLIDLKSINYRIYPFIKLKSNFKSPIVRKVPQIKTIQVVYKHLPEITFNPELKNDFYTKIIQEGDSVKWKIGLTNLSKYKTDSIYLNYQVSTNNSLKINQKLTQIPSLNPFESKEITIKEKTVGLSGSNTLQLNLKVAKNDDLLNFNNTIKQDYTVERDIREPLINTLFDGKNIISGEIIQPKPIIDIIVRDENKFLILNDTNFVDIYLKSSNDNNLKRINFSDRTINLIIGTKENNNLNIKYTPAKLNDGLYSLRIRAKDVTGNYNVKNDYEIEFEVINESSITKFYPYPNPVVNSMKFVFTLTGEVIPEKIKIQITTTAGKVVREIFKEELGNVKIGNNISDFTWDGTDQYGDRLANGVYFYKVFIEKANEDDFKNRKTKGDELFKNQFGKIYLLR